MERCRRVSAAQAPKDNRLLAAMPDADLEAVEPMLERVAMPLGQAVYESGGPHLQGDAHSVVWCGSGQMDRTMPKSVHAALNDNRLERCSSA